MNVRTVKLARVAAIGLAWAGAWVVFALVMVTIVGAVRPEDIDVGEGPVEAATVLGAVGLFAGLVFGLLLAVAERGRPVRDVALGRAALWGVAASAVFPLLTDRVDELLVLCPLGALLAVITVAGARWTARPVAQSAG